MSGIRVSPGFHKYTMYNVFYTFESRSVTEIWRSGYLEPLVPKRQFLCVQYAREDGDLEVQEWLFKALTWLTSLSSVSKV